MTDDPTSMTPEHVHLRGGPPTATPLTAAQETLLRGSGAGSLADLAKMSFAASTTFGLTVEQCAASGAGFVQDSFRARGLQGGGVAPPPLFDAAVQNIQNANQPSVTVASADFPRFPLNSTVRFASTGNATLDAAAATFTVISVNSVGKTFKISADLSAAPSSIKQGTIFLLA